MFKIFSKAEAISFLANFYFDVDYYRGESVFVCWYPSKNNPVIAFLEDIRNMGTKKFIKEFEKFVKNSTLDDKEEWTVDDFSEYLKYYKRVASSVIEEYLKQPKQPSG